MEQTEFAGQARIHVGLAVADVAAAERFYRVLFDALPTKQRPGYAKFEPASPPVNLSLHQVERTDHAARRPEEHFGIQVKSVQAVEAAVHRMQAAGLAPRVEPSTNCCYAGQSKLWVTDPDGHRWEVFVVIEPDVSQGKDDATGCCATGTCG